MDKLRLRVLDAHALGDPGFLGEAVLELRPLQLEPNAPPINLWLPLQARPLAVTSVLLAVRCLLMRCLVALVSCVPAVSSSINFHSRVSCSTSRGCRLEACHAQNCDNAGIKHVCQSLQGSRAGSVHLQLQLIVKTPTAKPVLVRSSSAGKPKEPGAGVCHGKQQQCQFCTSPLMAHLVGPQLGSHGMRDWVQACFLSACWSYSPGLHVEAIYACT